MYNKIFRHDQRFIIGSVQPYEIRTKLGVGLAPGWKKRFLCIKDLNILLVNITIFFVYEPIFNYRKSVTFSRNSCQLIDPSRAIYLSVFHEGSK